MQLSNQQTLPVGQQQAWEALNDVSLLQASIPGCESITPSGDNQYEVAITAAVGYANAVPASREFIPKEIAEDPVVYPPADAKLYTATLVTQKFERERNRLWTRIKTGR